MHVLQSNETSVVFSTSIDEIAKIIIKFTVIFFGSTCEATK